MVQVQAHGQTNLDCVPVVPRARQGQVTLRLRRNGLLRPVDPHLDALGRPVGNTDLDRQFLRILRRQRECGRIGPREVRLLPDGHALFFPVELRRNKEIHPQRRVVVIIDCVAILRVILNARANATPHGVLWRTVGLEMPWFERIEIGDPAGERIL